MLAVISGMIAISGLKNKLTNIPTQNDEHTGHNRISRIIGIFRITFLRIYPQIFELFHSCDVLIAINKNMNKFIRDITYYNKEASFFKGGF